MWACIPHKCQRLINKKNIKKKKKKKMNFPSDLENLNITIVIFLVLFFGTHNHPMNKWI